MKTDDVIREFAQDLRNAGNTIHCTECGEDYEAPAKHVCRPRKKYIAIVIECGEPATLAPGMDFLQASTTLGNHLRDKEREFLPEGCRITRSISISYDMAHRGW